MNKIALFIANYSISISPSILNVLDYLSDNFMVDLYLKDVGRIYCPITLKSNIRIIEIDVINSPIMRLRSVFRTYSNFVAFDPHGFVLCKTFFPQCRPIYYSLELYMSYDYFGLDYSKYVKEKERALINDIHGLIIQSYEKDELFRDNYKLSQQIPTYILPVTYSGVSSSNKSDYLRKKFKIDDNLQIALHLGGIGPWYSCFELATQFSQLSKWALVFHGFTAGNFDIQELENHLIRNKITNVYLNNNEFDDISQLDNIISSSDLGVAWYNDISIGFRTAGHSSGKIPAYMRFGLPIIAKKYRSTLEAIEYCGAGICIDSLNEIESAINKIKENYDTYSIQSIKTYNIKYKFDNYKDSLMKFICK